MYQPGSRRAQIRDHFNPGGFFFDGQPRPEAPPSAPASLLSRAPRYPTEPIPNGSSALYFGVQSSPRLGTSASLNGGASTPGGSQYGMKRNDWFGNETPAVKEQRLRSQTELQQYQSQQLRELADRRRRESEEKRSSSGWILDSEFSRQRQGSARISYQISEPFYNQKTMASSPSNPKLKSFVDPVHKDLTDKDREYMQEICKFG